MRTLSTLLALASLACPAFAQNANADQDAAKTQKNEVRERVGTLLTSLEKAGSFHCETESVSPAPAFLRQLGGGEDRKVRTTVVKEGGSLICWSKDQGDQVLARHGTKWVLLDRDGDWVPCRVPVGPIWGGSYLPDPGFLANRLRHVLAKTKWEATSKTVGERQLRLYSTKLTLDQATHVVRSGALPAAGGLGGLGGAVRMAVGGLGGPAALPPEPEREVELELYEDPKTRMPLRLVARIFAEGGPMGNVRIAIGGAGGAVEEIEEEEEGEGKKKKPATTLTFEFSKFGEATAKDLNKAGRAHLGLIR